MSETPPDWRAWLGVGAAPAPPPPPPKAAPPPGYRAIGESMILTPHLTWQWKSTNAKRIEEYERGVVDWADTGCKEVWVSDGVVRVSAPWPPDAEIHHTECHWGAKSRLRLWLDHGLFWTGDVAKHCAIPINFVEAILLSEDPTMVRMAVVQRVGTPGQSRTRLMVDAAGVVFVQRWLPSHGFQSNFRRDLPEGMVKGLERRAANHDADDARLALLRSEEWKRAVETGDMTGIEVPKMRRRPRPIPAHMLMARR